MLKEILRFLALVTAGILIYPANSKAAVLEQSFIAKNATFGGESSLFSDIGIDVTSKQDMTFRWSFDTSFIPFIGPTEFRNERFDYDQVWYPYATFSVEIDGVEIAAVPAIDHPYPLESNFLYLRDGRDGIGNTNDFFNITSSTNIELESTVTFLAMTLRAFNYDETLLTGLEFPTSDEWEALLSDELGAQIFGEVLLKGSDGSFSTLTFSNTEDFISPSGPIAPVPLPATLPLLVLGLFGMGFLRRVQLFN